MTAMQTAFHISVDYHQSFAKMIAAGAYDVVNRDITAEHFPIIGKGTVEEEVLLVDFGRDMDDDEVTRELGQMELEDVPIEHLLVVGARYPELQRGYPIIARRSVWVRPDGFRIVPCLAYWSPKRKLDLVSLSHRWPGHCRFLVRHKKN